MPEVHADTTVRLSSAPHKLSALSVPQEVSRQVRASMRRTLVCRECAGVAPEFAQVVREEGGAGGSGSRCADVAAADHRRL